MDNRYSEQQKQIALSFLAATRGNIAQAARKSGVSENAIRYWQHLERERAETDSLVESNRPRPPLQLIDPGSEFTGFCPAPEIGQWVQEAFLSEDSPLYNEQHWHLASAEIGFLWTNTPCQKKKRRVVGMAEIPLATIKDPWLKARSEQQMKLWFSGEVPDFVITLDASFCAAADDATFCALVEHELYHCVPAVDSFGFPKFNRKTGKPVFTLQGHDAEEFVGVVRRYGPGAAAGGVADLVNAAQKPPLVAPADISRLCGTTV